jgi:hypothetical protein
MRVGAHVQQGEIIGYVGMTGLATGPHLHYEYLVNGVHKNPQTVQLPGAEPLRAGTLQKFRGAAAQLLADLSPPQTPGSAAPVAAAPVAGAPAPLADAPLAGAGPLATEPPPSSVFSVSSVLNDSRSNSGGQSNFGDDRSQIAIN